ncbi:MAG TPA: Nramp family divalent metal transporter [Agriterribacter sp.]|nr:Nramp family divalent metal transporter [Agriterribacter sp.]
MAMIADHYVITPKTIREPPASFISKFKFLGPGFILSASIVGSGELIATTILGARAGFIMFWLIILSCLVKVAIQLQFGRHTIISGETVMQSFNKLPGFRFYKSHWSIWAVLFLMLLKVVQVGGMLGGSALVMHLLFPAVAVPVWVVSLAVTVALLVFKNYYNLVEKTSLVMIALFTILTIVSLIAVGFTDYAFTFSDIASGLGLRLPRELVFLAIGAFGITGVGSDEILSYNYWCIEKGYAAYAGPNTGTPEWQKRAKGWISVMYLDALVAMVIYTAVTASFYLLGAAVLHTRTEVPEGYEVINVLANIYTQTLGENVKIAFLAGAFFVLFSSVFTTVAYWSRLFSDIFGQVGWIRFFDLAQRRKTIAILSFVFPAAWAIVFLFIKLPVIMIISGGVVGSVLLLIIVFAALCFRYRGSAVIQRSLAFDIFFWLSVLSIALVAVYGMVQLF